MTIKQTIEKAIERGWKDLKNEKAWRPLVLNEIRGIVIIDEVEKLFHGGTDDSGVTSRMLSSILWWLQEHKSKVLTVMTTNKEADIPPELYRPGRIDREIKFTNLNGKDEIVGFALPLVQKLVEEVGIPKFNWSDIAWKDSMSHAEVTEVLKQRVLKVYLSQQKEG